MHTHPRGVFRTCKTWDNHSDFQPDFQPLFVGLSVHYMWKSSTWGGRGRKSVLTGYL